MKTRLFCLAMILCLLFTSGAFALEFQPYQQHFGNEASFETLEEAHANGPAQLSGLTGRTYIADPALDKYPVGTTFVYRSAKMYTSLTAAYRMNTNIMVYSDKNFASKDDALVYLKGLGLTDIIDKAYGSVVLVTPIDKENGFGPADQYAYLQLQSAMCNLGFSVRNPDKTVNYYADNTYFGGLTYRYVIGIDGGANFICNYVSNTLDYIGRIAGMLLVNPSMNKTSDAASIVPVYLVNGTDAAFAKYQAVNEAYAVEKTKDKDVYFNQQFPLRKVVVSKDGSKDLINYVQDAYYSLFVKTMRVPVVKAGLYVAANEFSKYSWNQAPYTLTARNAILGDATADGIYVVEHQEDRFASIASEKDGEYLNRWYEFLPKEVLDNTATEHSIPLILCNHGGGDDPVQAADEMGLITLAGSERIALVAPRYATDIPTNTIMDGSPFDVNGQSLPALVKYMLDTYPALDPARVYATGYSMGGAATVQAVECAPQLFAAAVPMAAGTPWGIYTPTDVEAAAFKTYDVPMMFTTSQYDLDGAFSQKDNTLGKGYQEVISRFSDFDEKGAINFDFATYPMVGFNADKTVNIILNDEYANTTWYKNNQQGVPMIAVSYTELLPHGLHPEYGTLAWNFLKHYSRNTTTGELVYKP